ncbi:MAG: carbohydrate binding family 9 domain-containing protein [FCB group bacterium]|nr:carbohydrate binding family 9 domain-containing protein [FCB group bacterium]
MFTSTGKNTHIGISLCILMVLIGGDAAIADESFVPVYLPTMETIKIASSIKIDGELDDPGWVGAGRADNFVEHEPGDQTQPPAETEALVTYDDHYLYVAFICHDDPATIRASYCDRDNIFSDDNVILLLDTYGDGSWAYEIAANPYGIQGDLLYSQSGGEDIRYDMIYESAGKITDTGYQVEMAIPFTSLRFPQKPVQSWRIDFWRNHPRDFRRQYSWAAYNRDVSCWLCQWGHIGGIADIPRGRGLEFLPAFVANQSGLSDSAGLPFENDNGDGEFSFGLKYSISSNVTAEATFNPDFSQIEADAAQIDVNSTFALSFPERRPFFQEGSDLYRSRFNAVYTRTINDPVFAAKLIGRSERLSMAFMTARDDHSPVLLPFEEGSESVSAGKSISNVFRARQTYGDDSHLGLILTDRRFDDGGYGTLLSADATVRLTRKYSLDLQLVGSYTGEPDDTALTSDFNGELFDGGRYTADFDGESFSGYGYYVELDRDARHWEFDVSYREKNPRFRPDLGFDPVNSRRELNFQSDYTFYINSAVVDNIEPSLILGRVWDFGRARRDEWAMMELDAQLMAQTSISASYMVSWERFQEIIFPAINRVRIRINSRFSNPLGAGIHFMNGHTIARNQDTPVMGNETSISVWGYIKPTNRMRIEPSYDYNVSYGLESDERLFEGYIGRCRINYQLTREMSLRLVVQYDDFDEKWDFDPLLSYRLNPFSVFYIGTTYDYNDWEAGAGGPKKWTMTSRQFFMKLQYLFQA